MLVVLLI